MNLRNKSEFKKFVKGKLRDGENVSISMYHAKYGENKPLWHIVSLYPRNEYVTSYKIVKSKSGEIAKSKFYKYCQWLTECEDETSVHYGRLPLCKTINEKIYLTKNKSKVTCKRCLTEMDSK